MNDAHDHIRNSQTVAILAKCLVRMKRKEGATPAPDEKPGGRLSVSPHCPECTRTLAPLDFQIDGVEQ